MSRFRQFYNKYGYIFKQGGYIATSVQTAALMATGDIISQTVVEKRRSWGTYSGLRTVRFASIGLIVLGPCLTKWYLILDKVVGSKGRNVGIRKMILDQLCFSPTFMAVFLIFLELVQFHPLEGIPKKLKETYTDLLMANYRIWPLVQLINFSLVPLKFQVLLVQFVAIFWNTYVSWTTMAEKGGKLGDQRTT